jgi:hypothetical protein
MDKSMGEGLDYSRNKANPPHPCFKGTQGRGHEAVYVIPRMGCDEVDAARLVCPEGKNGRLPGFFGFSILRILLNGEFGNFYV